MNKTQLVKAEGFRELHKQAATFVLPDAWDVMSAKAFEQSGFKAIATTSAGIAKSLGYADGQDMPFEQLIEVVSLIANAVNVPVSADIEAGYGFTVEEIADNVRQVIEVGAVGINIEDGTGDFDGPVMDLDLQIENIIAIRALSDSLNASLFINARTDMYWANVGNPEVRFQEAIKRALAFESAGADCIFIPGLTDLKIIEEFRKEIAVPINLLAHPKLPSLKVLSQIGVERVSCGTGPFRAVSTLLKNISDEIINDRSFNEMTNLSCTRAYTQTRNM